MSKSIKEVELISNNNPIVATIFSPNEKPKFAFILSCPTGTKQTYYKKFAQYLQSKGHLAITYDYSGIGKSAPKQMKGYPTSLTDWGKHDLTTIIDYVSTEFQYEKLIIMGLSIGGQIPGLSPSINKADALVNVAAQSGYWRMWPIPIRFILFFNWHVLQWIAKLIGFFPGKRLNMMENLPKGVAIEWGKWGLKKDYLFHFIPQAEESFTSIKKPLIAYSFSDDRTAPKAAVDWMTAKYSNCETTRIHIKPKDIGVKKIGHFGFFREKCKPLWEELLERLQVLNAIEF